MPGIDFHVNSVLTLISKLSFPKLGVSGVCIRRPGELDKKFFETVEEALAPYEFTNAIIPKDISVRRFTFMDECPLYAGTFCFVKGRKKILMRPLELLREETRNQARMLMGDFIESEFTDESSQVMITDFCLITMVCHDNWRPEEKILSCFKEWEQATHSTMQDIPIPGSGGYRLIKAKFIH